MPNQYSAADLINVPRVYTYTGESNVGSSGLQPGFNSFQAGTFVDENNFNSIANSSYPNINGSYNSNEGDLTPSGMDFATHIGYGVDTIHYPGYYNHRPLASGEIVHTVTVDPSGINGGLLDPWLQSDV